MLYVRLKIVLIVIMNMKKDSIFLKTAQMTLGKPLEQAVYLNWQ